MINVKVVPRQENKEVERIKSLTYYFCKNKKSNKPDVFILCPKTEKDRQLVIWLNSEYGNDGLGWDYFTTIQDDYYDFQEIKDADLTFYV